MDITGRFHQTVYDIFNEQDAQTEHYSGSGSAYEDMSLNMLEPYRKNETDEYIQRVQRFNTVCFRGMQYTLMKQDGTPAQQSEKDASMKITHLNTGHWGTNIYAGVRKVREGENAFMKQCDYDLGNF